MGSPVVARRVADFGSPGLSTERVRGGARLGQPVAADALAPEALLHLGQQLGTRRGAADRDLAQAREVPLGQRRLVEERAGHGGHEEQPGDALGLHQAQDLGRVEAGEQHVHAPEPGDVVRRAPAVHVEEGDGVEHDVGAGQAVGEGGVDRVQVEVAVAEDDALRLAGGAARVEELGRRRLVDGRRGEGAGGRRRQPGLVLLAEQDGP